MSRIYEALQKAESERGLERAPERNEREDPIDPARTFSGMDRPAAVAEVEYETPVVLPIAETAGTTSFTSKPDGALNLEAVARRPWSPSLTQLPSLLERGPAVEQFRSLRSRIFELRDIRPLKTILVTSGMPQEGKSFVSANLALSLARHRNSKVLLIDGDMRRFTLHQLLGCESQPGLAEYLGGKAGMLDVMQRAEAAADAHQSLPAALSNVTFIPGGNGGDRAADLSGSPRFEELIKAASPYFDWIVVDSSPVIPVSDAVNLARACDGVLLVARGGVTKFPDAQRAQSELKASNVLGFVLNAVPEAPQVGDYYGYSASQD
jgi:capsular exopolysaccharide synthesis family protein